jgi:hypothetical protein
MFDSNFSCSNVAIFAFLGDINLAVKAQTNYTIADLKSSIVKHALQVPNMSFVLCPL